MPTTSRWNLPYPAGADNPAIHTAFQDLANSLDDVAKDYSQSTFANRPVSTPGSPGKAGRFFHATDRKVLYRDFGTGWTTVSRFKIKKGSGRISTNAATATIATLTIPANTLISGDEIKILASGEGGGINGNKTIGLRIAGTDIINYTFGGANTDGFFLEASCGLDSTTLAVTALLRVMTDANGTGAGTVTNVTCVRGGVFVGDPLTLNLAADIAIDFRAGTVSTSDVVTLDAFTLEIDPV